MTDPTNGGPDPEGPEDAEASKLQQLVLGQMAQAMAQEILAFSPGLDPQRALAACIGAVQAHHEGALTPVLEDAVANSPMRTERELWGFRLMRGDKAVSQMVVRKDVAEIARTKPDEFVGWLMVFGALTNPKVLAFVRAHGFEISFHQSRANRIVT